MRLKPPRGEQRVQSVHFGEESTANININRLIVLFVLSVLPIFPRACEVAKNIDTIISLSEVIPLCKTESTERTESTGGLKMLILLYSLFDSCTLMYSLPINLEVSL
jgi:hypothetical protein